MKNLNIKKYKKKRIQKIKYEIFFKEEKISYEFNDYNLIGFQEEVYNSSIEDLRDKFYNYSHQPNYANSKLYKKYPHGILKKDYKRWSVYCVVA